MFGRYSRILLVDDSNLQRTLIRALVKGAGYENIDEAADGGAALAMLAVRSYRLVLSDWDMAPVNGAELLRTMRNDVRWKRLPFILMTAHTQRKFTEVARDDGITYFLAKPLTVDKLVERIDLIGRAAAA